MSLAGATALKSFPLYYDGSEIFWCSYVVVAALRMAERNTKLTSGVTHGDLTADMRRLSLRFAGITAGSWHRESTTLQSKKCCDFSKRG